MFKKSKIILFLTCIVAAYAAALLSCKKAPEQPGTALVVNDLYLPEMYGDDQTDGPQEVQYISIHCSVANSKRPLTGKDIMRIAGERGFKRPPYHFFIRRWDRTDTLVNLNNNAVLEDKELCWTVAGYNSRTIGVCIDACYIDYPEDQQDNRTTFQDSELKRVIAGLRKKFPRAKVLGHHEFPNVHKVCPGFEASKIYGNGN